MQHSVELIPEILHNENQENPINVDYVRNIKFLNNLLRINNINQDMKLDVLNVEQSGKGIITKQNVEKRAIASQVLHWLKDILKGNEPIIRYIMDYKKEL